MSESGEKNGVCNRFACDSEDEVVWYNHFTRKYYCKECGPLLNVCNRVGANIILGHELCTDDS